MKHGPPVRNGVAAWPGFAAWLDGAPAGPWSWVLSLGFVAVAIGLRLALMPLMQGVVFVTFYPAVIAAVVLWGWRQALAVLALSLIGAFLVARSPYLAMPGDPGLLVRQVVFVVTCGIIIAAVDGLRALNRRLRTAVALQETLFLELQHRVANNMQVVAITLAELRRGLADPAAAEQVAQAEARVTAMARLHRRVYDGEAYRGGLEPVLREVLEEALHGLPVQVSLRIEDAGLTVGQMTTLLLLVNEAALNAAKHVFRPGHGTALAVTLGRDAAGMARLVISDDGPGPGASPHATPGRLELGMRIMDALARQLDGTLTVRHQPGTTLEVAFPVG